MTGDNLAPSSCETGVEDTPLALGVDETDSPPANDGGQLEREQVYYFLFSFGTGLPIIPLGRWVYLVRVTDPTTAMIKEDEEQGWMAAGSTDILEFSPCTTVNVVSTIIIYSNRSERLMYFFTHMWFTH